MQIEIYDILQFLRLFDRYLGIYRLQRNVSVVRGFEIEWMVRPENFGDVPLISGTFTTLRSGCCLHAEMDVLFA